MSSSRSFFWSHHLENCVTATKYARRVLRLRMLAVKNSQKRRPADSERRKIAGSWSAEEAPTRASWRPEAGKLSGGGVMESIYDNVLYRIFRIHRKSSGHSPPPV